MTDGQVAAIGFLVFLGVVVGFNVASPFAGALFELGRGVFRPWSMVRLARADLTIARMRLESEQVNAEMRRLGQ